MSRVETCLPAAIRKYGEALLGDWGKQMSCHKFDFLGQPIIEGDNVVWAVRQSSSMWLNTGVVITSYEDGRLRVEPTGCDTPKLLPTKRTVLLSRNAHVVRIPEW